MLTRRQRREALVRNTALARHRSAPHARASRCSLTSDRSSSMASARGAGKDRCGLLPGRVRGHLPAAATGAGVGVQQPVRRTGRRDGRDHRRPSRAGASRAAVAESVAAVGHPAPMRAPVIGRPAPRIRAIHHDERFQERVTRVRSADPEAPPGSAVPPERRRRRRTCPLKRPADVAQRDSKHDEEGLEPQQKALVAGRHGSHRHQTHHAIGISFGHRLPIGLHRCSSRFQGQNRAPADRAAAASTRYHGPHRNIAHHSVNVKVCTCVPLLTCVLGARHVAGRQGGGRVALPQ
jgi:hypothetical protein